MLIRLTPQAPHPTVLFTIAFNNLPETLPSPLSWTNQLNCLSADELEVPLNHHCLDKAAAIPNLLENVSFDLTTLTASCTFVDGVMAEWPIMDSGCLRALQGVVSDVSMSALEAERERFREREEEKQRLLDLMTPPPSPTKPKGHKKQRSLLMSIVASLVPLGSSRLSSSPTLPTSAPPSPPPSPRPSSSSSASFFPSSGPSARTLRRRARSTLVDTFRRYILPELALHFPKGGYYAWVVQSTLRRATFRINALMEKSGGYIPDIGRPRRADWVECNQDPYLDTTTACTPSSLYDDDDDTDTDGSSVHTPSSSHFNTMTSAYHTQFASSSSQTPTLSDQPRPAYHCPSYAPQPMLTPQEIDEYHLLSGLIDRLRQLYLAVQAQNVHIDNENAHHEAMLEIRSRRRAWLNRSLVGGAQCSSRNVGLSMPFRSSPLAQSSWTSEEYDLVMTPINLDMFAETKRLDPDYEVRLSEGVSRLRLSDGPKLFPVLEEHEGDYEDDQVFVQREFGLEFGVDLERGHCADAQPGMDGEVGSDGLEVEFDAPHIRPRLRTSSMMAHRQRFETLPISDSEFPSSPSSASSSLPSTPTAPPPALPPSPQPHHQLDSSSLLCQPLHRSLQGSPVELVDSRMAMELERPQVYSDMDVDMGAYDARYGQDQEFTLAMDIPLRMHTPVRGRKQQLMQRLRDQLPPPGYTMGIPDGEDDWVVSTPSMRQGVVVDCR